MRTIADKLFDNLAITDEGCWEFVGGRTGANYGVVSIRKFEQKGAHVVSFEYFNGPVQKGMQICHSCDNPPCCNPEHLFLGTCQDNKDDEIAKGRHVFGEKGGNSKLTEGDVLEIKKQLSLGATQYSLAKQFKVTKQAIWRIKEGLCWRHLNG